MRESIPDSPLSITNHRLQLVLSIRREFMSRAFDPKPYIYHQLAPSRSTISSEVAYRSCIGWIFGFFMSSRTSIKSISNLSSDHPRIVMNILRLSPLRPSHNAVQLSKPICFCFGVRTILDGCCKYTHQFLVFGPWAQRKGHLLGMNIDEAGVLHPSFKVRPWSHGALRYRLCYIGGIKKAIQGMVFCQ